MDTVTIHTQRAEALEAMSTAFYALAEGFKKLAETYNDDSRCEEINSIKALQKEISSTEKPPIIITRADIDEICNRLREKKLTAKIKELLKAEGLAKLSELPTERYPEFYECLRDIENGK